MPERWTLLYDADCGFCTWVVSVVLSWDRHGVVEPCALQSERAAGMLSDLSADERLAEVHLVAPDGTRRSGGAALQALLELLPGGGPPARLLGAAPRLTERGYRAVADHRTQVSRLVPAALKRRARDRVMRTR